MVEVVDLKDHLLEHQVRLDKDMMVELTDVIEQLVEVQIKAKMPDMTVDLRKAKSPREVADLIAAAWYTYGAGEVADNEDGSSSLSIKNEMETFDKAMKYLWYKAKDDGTYSLTGSPYLVAAVDNNGVIEVTVMPKAGK